ncbi:MAG: hypothetical protein M3Y54_09475 [Bacteroidota bacterium]|nr:hypothetical protein [Bacteroidota bacterium]
MSRFLLLVLFPLLAAHLTLAQTPTRQASAGASVMPVAGRAQVRGVQSDASRRFMLVQVLLPDAAVAARVNRQLADIFAENLEKPAGQSATRAVQQALAEYKAANRHGFTNASYDVLYNGHYLLSVALHYEYMGAYPSTATHHATFNLRTGQLLTVGQLVQDTLALRRRWQASISRAVATTVAALPTDYPDMEAGERPDIEERFGWNAKLKKVIFAPGQPHFDEFGLTTKGLELYHSFEFPHVIQALEPDGTCLIPYSTLKAWLQPSGLLSFRK